MVAIPTPILSVNAATIAQAVPPLDHPTPSCQTAFSIFCMDPETCQCQICMDPPTCNSKHLVICKKMWTLEPRQRASKSCWSFSCWYSPRATAGAGPTNYLASFPASKQCKWISLMIWFHHIIDRLEWNLISDFDHLMWIHYQNWSKGSIWSQKKPEDFDESWRSDSNNSQLRDSTPLISPSDKARPDLDHPPWSSRAYRDDDPRIGWNLMDHKKSSKSSMRYINQI